MKKYVILFFVITSIASTSFSQIVKQFTIEPLRTAVMESDDTLNVFINNVPFPFPGGDDKQNFLDSIKKINEGKYPRKHSNNNLKKSKTDLNIGTSFSINLTTSGFPNDNCVAISNDDILITVINSSFQYFDLKTISQLKKQTLAAGFTNSTKADAFDPKVIYDPIKDRFILIFLKNRTSTDNVIVVAFSSSNNPMDPWYIYEIPGNPNSVDQWTDYPSLAITDDELFLTGNLIQDGQSWQAGFKGSIIWQINKDDGYSNQTLSTQLWQNIEYDGKLIRNLHPISNYNYHIASKPTNDIAIDNQYFLSNKNFDADNDTIFLIEVTAPISNSPSINITPIKSSDRYFLAPNGKQPGGYEVATNDNRVLGAIINRNMGIIQFVQHTMNISTGTSAIYHGFVENIATIPTCRANIISDPVKDLGYPNIACVSKNFGENDVIIGVNHSSSIDYPGMSAVFVNSLEEYSELTTIVVGTNYAQPVSGSLARWGDYSGIQRKYNKPGTVWFNASYGTDYNTSVTNKYGVWITELFSANFVSTNTFEMTNKTSIYPNPTSNYLIYSTTTSKQDEILISIYDVSGKLLFTTTSFLRTGENDIIIPTEKLKNGLYTISILTKTDNSVLFQEKIKINK